MAQLHAIKWLAALLAVQFVTSEPPNITKTDNGVFSTMKYVNQPVMELNSPSPLLKLHGVKVPKSDPSPESEPSSRSLAKNQEPSEEPGKDAEPQLPLPKPLPGTETDQDLSPATELEPEPSSHSLAKNEETSEEPGKDAEPQLPLPKPLPRTETDTYRRTLLELY